MSEKSNPKRRPLSEIRRTVGEFAAAVAYQPAAWPRLVTVYRQRVAATEPMGPLPGSVAALETVTHGQNQKYLFSDLESFGKGGMNSVSKGREVITGRVVILRRHLPSESAVEEEVRSRRELIVQDRLTVLQRHPIIPRFWATGEFEGQRCEVFDFAPGISLASYVADKGLTYGDFLDFGFHAARGLFHLHRQGLIHGDVKPENFCVEKRQTKDGLRRLRVQLIDFDIVSTQEEQIRQYALGNALEGTLPYMPPENFWQDVPEDEMLAERMVFSKDVFALGLTLYRIGTGRFPENFYTSVESLLAQKVEGAGLELRFHASWPRELRQLVELMCASDWAVRPALRYVVQTFRRFRDSVSEDERESLITVPEAPDAESATAAMAAIEGEHVGPYLVVNQNFYPRSGADGQTLPLAALRDRFGRSLIGVPFAFLTEEEELAFYEERNDALKKLNALRIKHPEHFPGSFRDLVRERRGGQFLVWIIRPLLDNAKDLYQFLGDENPDASLRERIQILRKTAEALALLEEAGFHLPKLTPELIFFIALENDVPGISLTRGAITRPVTRMFDVLSRKPEHRFRQELMGTASVRRGAMGLSDPTIDGFLKIADEIAVLHDLGAEEKNLFMAIREAATWRDRLNILLMLEMQQA
jgi:serine/threonine protein kinase